MIREVMRRDLLMAWRDTRTVISVIVLPLVLLPMMTLGLPMGMSAFFKAQGDKRQKVAVIGTLPPELAAALESEKSGVELVAAEAADEASVKSLAQSGRYDAALWVPERLATAEDEGDSELHIFAKLSSLSERAGALNKVEAAVNDYNRLLLARRLEGAGLSEELLPHITLKEQDTSTARERSSGVMAFVVPMLIANLLFSSAMSVAVDSTAGEKERGTLESLLASPLRRSEVVLGKILAVVVGALFGAFWGVVGFFLTGFIGLALLLSGVLEKDLADFSGVVNEGGGSGFDLATTFGLIVSSGGMAFVASALLLAVAIRSKSTKEAQTQLTPVLLVLVMPAFALQMADSMPSGAYAIPVFGSMMTMLDSIKGNLDLQGLAMSTLSNAVATALLAWFAHLSFSKEEILFQN